VRPGLTQHMQTGQKAGRPGPQVVGGKIVDPGVYAEKAGSIRVSSWTLEFSMGGAPGNLRPRGPLRFEGLLYGQYV
jgi:hypothetical protein